METYRHLILIFGSFLYAFILAIIFAPPFIEILKKYKLGKNIREDSVDGLKATIFNELHFRKKGTPTMGGILIWGTVLLVVIISRILSYAGIIEHSLINRKETYLAIFTLITMALLGAFDDYFNIKGIGKTKGINVKPKFIWLMIFAILGSLWFYFKLEYNQIHIPFLGDLHIGIWYIPLFILVLLSTSNAVNITDGLDGLAGGILINCFAVFTVLSYFKGLFILSALCAVIIGALLAFLWYNIHPAKFYMGDTGSLALGGTLGVIALMTDSVLILPIVGIVFVVETLSVLIQLFSKKFFKRKEFHIAPLHHHFEKIGWPESQITMRFWIISTVFSIIGLILGLVSI
ncbi:phospho-N-acetylmuramoyl-pentapeptide-transferase [Candidatus Peregrinibacteria bacterium RIFOXYC2_FULL_33_13]|nr:MAG: phospho-N-acetylmuramoyl-pentapeptide-transferase [Candidatus Peregrinibacteria bacterium RIFOXYC2_FULL_33_13]